MLKVKSICPGCGLCLPACPTGALMLKDGKAAVVGSCVECGLCVDVCPVKALVIEQEKKPVVETTKEVKKRGENSRV